MADFFIRRPIVAIVIAIITVIAGLVAMKGLPTAQFPDIVPPQIQVQTTYTGADAVTICAFAPGPATLEPPTAGLAATPGAGVAPAPAAGAGWRRARRHRTAACR